MKKGILVCALFLCAATIHAQLEVAKLLGGKGDDYKLGYGAFLKLGYPVSEASDVNVEIGATFFSAKTGGGDGLAIIPLKAGYRYTINGTGSGVYVEPQVGFNIYGTELNNGDGPFNGPMWAIGTGYLFQPLGGLRLNLGLRYESILYKGGSLNYLALRLSHDLSLMKRE